MTGTAGVDAETASTSLDRRLAVGLVVGKFSPLHLGHEFLIRTARSNCDRLLVVSWSRPGYAGCEPFRRRRWLAGRFGDDPGIECHVLEPEAVPVDDAPADEQRSFVVDWLRNSGLGRGVDAVFTSEAYGDGFAGHLAAAFERPIRHRCVDLGRLTIPVSATAVREGRSTLLSPEVAADYADALAGESSSGR
jgi:cytidyltransferase-like protein